MFGVARSAFSMPYTVERRGVVYEFSDMTAFEMSAVESEFIDSFAEWWGETCANCDFDAQNIDFSLLEEVSQDSWRGRLKSATVGGRKSLHPGPGSSTMCGCLCSDIFV
jgi:hypothetical protein